ncbi:hypothetical protein BJ741DRAFT_123888 [Chytriomyces cf. hyalinus JEL632]|nr:hypothetical protein BJ741DRAFT_123888 [Chytriomyces cf. hyalinus JEL632]
MSKEFGVRCGDAINSVSSEQSGCAKEPRCVCSIDVSPILANCGDEANSSWQSMYQTAKDNVATSCKEAGIQSGDSSSSSISPSSSDALPPASSAKQSPSPSLAPSPPPSPDPSPVPSPAPTSKEAPPSPSPAAVDVVLSSEEPSPVQSSPSPPFDFNSIAPVSPTITTTSTSPTTTHEQLMSPSSVSPSGTSIESVVVSTPNATSNSTTFSHDSSSSQSWASKHLGAIAGGAVAALLITLGMAIMIRHLLRKKAAKRYELDPLFQTETGSTLRRSVVSGSQINLAAGAGMTTPNASKEREGYNAVVVSNNAEFLVASSPVDAETLSSQETLQQRLHMQFYDQQSKYQRQMYLHQQQQQYHQQMLQYYTSDQVHNKILFNSGTPVMLESSGSSSSNVEAWSVVDACAWVDSNQLGDESVLNRMQEHGIDGCALMLLTLEHVEHDLGVSDAEQAAKFMNALDELKETRATA